MSEPALKKQAMSAAALNFINGESKASVSGAFLDVVSPSNGEVVNRVTLSTVAVRQTLLARDAQSFARLLAKFSWGFHAVSPCRIWRKLWSMQRPHFPPGPPAR